MNKKGKKTYSAPRWNEWQHGKVLDTKIPQTKKDKEDIKEFKKFIDDKLKEKSQRK